MENYDQALEKFSQIRQNSVFYKTAQKEYYKTFLQAGKYDKLLYADIDENKNRSLLYLAYLFSSQGLPEKQDFLDTFPSAEKEKLLYFYNFKKDPPYKSALLSGIMSALIPGSGKVYLSEIGDGITAFLTTSLLAFLAYDNFHHNHNFRGWLFSGLGFFFYAGNIYGSVAAAQIHNAQIDYEYNSDLRDYLKNKNYFLPQNDFIK
jgi:TM2 domain-containing membrane protein YozV